MPCNTCGSTSGSSYSSTPCSCNSATDSSTDSSLIIYTGPDLSCIDVETGATVQSIIESINATACNASSDWSDFEYNCLDNLCSCTITSPRDFVSAMTSQFCTFVNVTFPDYQDDITSEIANIFVKFNSNCSLFNNTDSLTEVITSLDEAICLANTNLTALNTNVNVSGANWSSCSIGVPANSSLTAAFNKIILKLCSLQTQIDAATLTLPTFNNTSTCIGGTSSDSLYNTVVAIRNLLCSGPTLVSSSCVDFSGLTTLTQKLQLIADVASAASEKRIVTVNGGIVGALTLSPVAGTCHGYDISLSSSLTDKYVKISADDTTPDYLFGGVGHSKLVAGSNITLTKNNAGSNETLTIAATVPAADDHLVLADVGGTPGVLVDKLTSTNTNDSVTISTSYNGGGDTVDIVPSINFETLSTSILNTINTNTTLLSQFCQMACNCNCDPITPPEQRFLSIEIRGISIATTQLSQITISQNTPNTTWFSGALTLVDGSYTTTSSTLITSSEINPQATLAITNLNASTTLYYRFYMTQSDGTTVIPNSTVDTNGSLAAYGDQVLFSPTIGINGAYALGEVVYPTDAILHIEISDTSRGG